MHPANTLHKECVAFSDAGGVGRGGGGFAIGGLSPPLSSAIVG